jgi:choline dehydrogenase-like flavoprotein
VATLRRRLFAVDGQIGTDGLLVEDASVMASIVSANTNATVFTIAECAAVLLTG